MNKFKSDVKYVRLLKGILSDSLQYRLSTNKKGELYSLEDIKFGESRGNVYIVSKLLTSKLLVIMAPTKEELANMEKEQAGNKSILSKT